MESKTSLPFALLCTVLLAGCLPATDTSALEQKISALETEVAALKTEKSGGVLVHISTGPETEDGRHKVGMALSFAVKAMKAGKTVAVFFDTKGVTVPLAEAENFSYQANDDSYLPSKDALNQLIAGGASVYVCPHCLHVAGYEPKDVMEGAELLENPGKLLNFADGPVITMDW